MGGFPFLPPWGTLTLSAGLFFEQEMGSFLILPLLLQNKDRLAMRYTDNNSMHSPFPSTSHRQNKLGTSALVYE